MKRWLRLVALLFESGLVGFNGHPGKKLDILGVRSLFLSRTLAIARSCSFQRLLPGGPDVIAAVFLRGRTPVLDARAGPAESRKA